jgi:hypothetical protein
VKIGRRTAVGSALALAVVAIVILLSRWGAMGRELPRPEHQVVARELTLQDFRQVRGSNVFRATLTDRSSGYSSGYGRSRNILFIEDSGEPRWLLPDDDHVLEEHAIPTSPAGDLDEEAAPVAMVILARGLDDESGPAILYLCDPAGKRVQRIAERVLDVDGTALTESRIAILYERSDGYVLAHYGQADFRLDREVKVRVPALK